MKNHTPRSEKNHKPVEPNNPLPPDILETTIITTKTVTVPQHSFRFRNADDKREFGKALGKQPHIASGAFFFQSCAMALIEASSNGEIVQWPIKFTIAKKAKPKGS